MSNKKVLVTVLRVKDLGDEVKGVRVSIIDRNTDEEFITCDVDIKNIKNLLSMFDSDDVEWSRHPIYMYEESDGVYYSPDEGDVIVLEIKTKKDALAIVNKYYKNRVKGY